MYLEMPRATHVWSFFLSSDYICIYLLYTLTHSHKSTKGIQLGDRYSYVDSIDNDKHTMKKKETEKENPIQKKIIC